MFTYYCDTHQKTRPSFWYYLLIYTSNNTFQNYSLKLPKIPTHKSLLSQHQLEAVTYIHTSQKLSQLVVRPHSSWAAVHSLRETTGDETHRVITVSALLEARSCHLSANQQMRLASAITWNSKSHSTCRSSATDTHRYTHMNERFCRFLRTTI